MNRLERVAQYVAATPAGSIPAEVTERAKLALLDYVGVTIAGLDEPVSRLIVRQIGRGGEATVIGHGFRSSPAEVALANATIGHALDYDDSNMVLGGHPSVPVLPAILALGQVGRRDGAAVLDAYVIGFEVMMAISKAVNFAHYEKGWHPTATIGTFGAAAACARILGLDARQAMVALSLAASMASGVKANFGTMAKPLQVGEAARRGVFCALLAAEGATASADALEGRQGFLNVYNGPGQYRAEALDELGNGFELMRSALKFKKYGCCGSTHAPIDAALSLRAEHGLTASEIASVRIGLNARRRPHVDRPVVAESLAAKFSVQFTVAAALADGAVGLRHFSDDAIARADLQSMIARTEVVDLPGGDSGLAQGCEIAVTTTRGEQFSVRLADALGRDTADYPSYMHRKFADCVADRFDAPAAAALAQRLLSFERCDVNDVMEVLAAGQSNEKAEVTP